MSWYQVQRSGHGPRSLRAWGQLGAGAFAAMLGLVVVYRSFVFMPVTVDGRDVSVPSGSTISEVTLREDVDTESGDLLAVVDGSVAETGGGAPARFFRNDVLVDGSARLYPGDVLRVVPGKDVTESTVATNRPIPIQARMRGRGPFLLMESPGAVGVSRVTIGEVSGQVVTETVVQAAVPMVFLRTYPSSGDRVIALTFDDGPWPKYTEQILYILRREHVPATFFMLGRNVNRWPQIARDVARQGHQVANHSWNHPMMGRMSAARVEAELGNTQRVISRTTKQTPAWFRPPGGSVSGTVYQEARDMRLQLVLWSVDPTDWRKPPSRFIVQRILDRAKPGAVVLLHDGGGDRAQTVNALPAIIRELRRRGYTFVRLDQMGGGRAPVEGVY